MSKANDIAAALVSRLQAITTANGYATNAGGTVYRGRVDIPDEALPCMTVFEPEDEIESQRDHDEANGADIIARLPFTIEASAVCDPDAPNVTGHLLVADIKRAVFSQDLTFGGAAVTTQYLGRNIASREAGATIVTATVKIRVGYIENLAAP